MDIDSMYKILKRDIQKLKKGDLLKTVNSRMKEFEKAGKAGSEGLFQELCFCLMTANFNAEKSIIIQDKIGNGFLTLPEKELSGKLKELGHRYPNARAGYIIEARKHSSKLSEIISRSGEEAREWLVKNVKGLGYKEASHFLRNIGFKDLAIVDFHIVDILTKHGLCDGRKPMTPKRYLEIEKTLQKLGKELYMNMAELDLYLWYCETGKVLK